MKYIWLPMTAALMTSFTVSAQETSSPQLSSEQVIADKEMSHDDVTQLYKDLDYDQVKTASDQCHNSNRKQGVNSIGCELDTDRDGVFDHNDQCPDTPSNRPVNFLGCAADSDDDGVIDPNDKCPLTPLGTLVDAQGCKIDNDLDKDGVMNSDDQCPNTPAGSKVNHNGCIPEAIALANIVFDTGSYEIRDDQVDFLQQDIKALKDLETEEVLLITGHTDAIGKESDNMTLSWNRASSVKKYLVSESPLFEASRIYLLGAGESQPIASNTSANGRQQNRRIHLEVMPSNQLPENAQLVLP
ncbi:OmpA family protein [Thiomicrorhabdus indica]|uniref:OmpA family protein n=1 Tax=Thiomicrorhabdus indica TaxID=2267253 RepID=UPI00102DF61F|nr:OmpA family protein [Thiomicrorhabdus indica]